MRIDVIVNTRARRYRAKPSLIDRMAVACADAAELHPTSNVAELADVCERLARRGTDLVALSGGDGSFMAGVTALARLRRALAAASCPAARRNRGDRRAELGRDRRSGCAPRADGRRGSRPPERRGHPGRVRRPTLRVRATTRSGGEERIGFIFGTGLVASFFDVYYERGGDGYGAAARIVARVFIESFYGGASRAASSTRCPARSRWRGGSSPHAPGRSSARLQCVTSGSTCWSPTGQGRTSIALTSSPAPCPLESSGRARRSSSRAAGSAVEDHFDDLVQDLHGPVRRRGQRDLARRRPLHPRRRSPPSERDPGLRRASHRRPLPAPLRSRARRRPAPIRRRAGCRIA